MEILIPLIILIVVVVVIVLIPVVIVRFYASRLEQAQQSQSQEPAGTEQTVLTEATIISASSHPGSTSTPSVTRVELRLKVGSPAGGTYEVTTVWLVDTAILPQLQPGQLVPVKIDSQDPRRVYPNLTGAQYYIWG